jgi:hypothetical protein
MQLPIPLLPVLRIQCSVLTDKMTETRVKIGRDGGVKSTDLHNGSHLHIIDRNSGSRGSWSGRSLSFALPFVKYDP